jgi:hypothetical protein
MKKLGLVGVCACLVALMVVGCSTKKTAPSGPSPFVGAWTTNVALAGQSIAETFTVTTDGTITGSGTVSGKVVGFGGSVDNAGNAQISQGNSSYKGTFTITSTSPKQLTGALGTLNFVATPAT